MMRNPRARINVAMRCSHSLPTHSFEPLFQPPFVPDKRSACQRNLPPINEEKHETNKSHAQEYCPNHPGA